MKYILLCFGLTCIASAETRPSKKLDTKATADWICNLFEVRDKQMFVATRDLEHLTDIRYRLPEGTEIKPLVGGFPQGFRGMIIDQPALYPVEIHCASLGYGEYELCINSPFLYLQDSVPPDIDPASREHPKETLIKESDFRPIAERVHAHFTRITQSKAHAFRCQSENGWPSEHYVWVNDKFTAVVSIYQSNDHTGLVVKVKKPDNDLQKFQQSRKGTEEPIRGWGKLIGDADD